jgi:hypothetical protein
MKYAPSDFAVPMPKGLHRRYWLAYTSGYIEGIGYFKHQVGCHYKLAAFQRAWQRGLDDGAASDTVCKPLEAT